MLFTEFFPRLQRRAFDRYGVIVTARQFKDWREDGLVPGPAAPKGRGRGRSPERHWPVSSYRRALRICRYKSHGAIRTSHWRIGFWLSGEVIAADLLRRDLKREFVSLRRRQRGIGESGRWQTGTFTRAKDIESCGFVPKGSGDGLLRMLGISADQFRRLTIQLFEETHLDADVQLMAETSPLIWENESAVAQPGTELRTLNRSGLLGEREDRPGDFIEGFDGSDFALCGAVWRAQRYAAVLEYFVFIAGDKRNGRHLLLHLLRSAPFLGPFDVASRVFPVIKILYELDRDKEDGVDPARRLAIWLKMVQEMKAALKSRTEDLREAGEMDYLRPSAIIADIMAR